MEQQQQKCRSSHSQAGRPTSNTRLPGVKPGAILGGPGVGRHLRGAAAPLNSPPTGRGRRRRGGGLRCPPPAGRSPSARRGNGSVRRPVRRAPVRPEQQHSLPPTPQVRGVDDLDGAGRSRSSMQAFSPVSPRSFPGLMSVSLSSQVAATAPAAVPATPSGPRAVVPSVVAAPAAWSRHQQPRRVTAAGPPQPPRRRAQDAASRRTFRSHTTSRRREAV